MMYIVIQSLFEGGTVGIMTTVKADDTCKKITMLSVHQMHWLYDDVKKGHGESMSI
jgi:hypothetical protein